ncbi:MAG: hypothetical protein AAGK22_25545 [Acidobacteriota bacterium]
METLLAGYGVSVAWVADGEDIPGSHWDAPEAGMIRGCLYVRSDTPVHSALHEGGHLVCMGAERRECVHTDAGGDDLEESAVCYLQILLAGQLEIGCARLMRDMDDWGYSFRLGSTRRWFEEDAEDARLWLEQHSLVRSGRLAPPPRPID